MGARHVYVEELAREWRRPYSELEDVFRDLGIVIKEGWVTAREQVWAHQVILGQPVEVVRSRIAAQLEKDGPPAANVSPGHDSTLAHCQCLACERLAQQPKTTAAWTGSALASGPERRFQQF